MKGTTYKFSAAPQGAYAWNAELDGIVRLPMIGIELIECLLGRNQVGEMILCPAINYGKRPTQGLPQRGEAVLDMRWNTLVVDAFNKTVAFEFTQRLCQHLL